MNWKSGLSASKERQALARERLALIGGGRSRERAISLKSARAVGAALRRLGLAHRLFDLTPRLADELRRAKITLAFLTTHGTYGEDGRLQGLLDILGIPYTGSGVRASAMAMHKPTAKRLFRAAGLATPAWTVAGKGEPARPAFPLPWVVKPAAQGSAVGVRIVKRPGELGAALRAAWSADAEALIETRVAGTEVTVGIVGDRVLPVVEIVPAHAFYDYHSKYARGGSRHIVPARLPARVQASVQDIAWRSHRAVGCRHVSRVDLIVPVRGRPQVLEVNTLPGLTSTSLLPDAARAAGLSFDELILALLILARHGNACGDAS